MVDAVDRTRKTPQQLSTAEEPPKKQAPAASRNATAPVWDESRVATSPTTIASAPADIAELNKTFTDSKSLATEIEQLKRSGALPMTVIMRQAQWVQLAKKEGQQEPTKPLDPKTATPQEIARAVVWTNIGGVIPRAELEKDGGKAYLASIRDAVAAHVETPDQRLAATGKQLIADAKEQSQRKYIGLDGRVGTEEQLVFYERTEAIAAMYGETTSGSIAATAPNMLHPQGPVDVPKMRGLGSIGDHAETHYSAHDTGGRSAPDQAEHVQPK